MKNAVASQKVVRMLQKENFSAFFLDKKYDIGIIEGFFKVEKKNPIKTVVS